jgi:nicotinate-nucleotide--dimethylbenzimidazole phosphoribosyltransferase
VTGQLPPEIEDVAGRITLPAASAPPTPAHVTGELRTLLAWWLSVSGGAAPIDRVIASEVAAGQDAAAAVLAGVEAAERAVDAGATLLVPRATTRHDTAARALVSVLTRTDPPAVTPQPEGAPDRAWMATVAAIRDDAYRLSGQRGDPLALLDGAAVPDIAFAVGVLLGGAARRTPCIVDGTDECTAALVADRISGRAKAWWMCGSQSTDPARQAVAERVDLAPGVPLALSDEAGFGAEATLALLRLVTGRV